MTKGVAILVGATALLAGNAHAQDVLVQSAGGALRTVLFRGPRGGPTGALSEHSSLVLYGLLLGETTTFPMGSSAGGFTWVFDAGLRVPVRRSPSFGPMFAERPFTTGRGRLNVGAAFQHTRFTSVGGQPLTHLETSTAYNFGSSIYRRTSSLEVEIDRTIVSATYGIHDRIDASIVVPIGRARVSGLNAYYQNDETGRNEEFKRESARGVSFGAGDVVIRAKTALTAPDPASRFDAAAMVDVRLPTGDPEKLLGTGDLQTKVMVISGTRLGSLTPHANVGYTFGGSGMTFGADNRWGGSFGDPELIRREPSREITYTVGGDIAVTSGITFAGDLLGRVVKDTATMTQFDNGASSENRVIFQVVTPGTVHLLLGAVGAKVRIGGSWLATGTILFPLNDNGIRPAVTPVIGFERAF